MNDTTKRAAPDLPDLEARPCPQCGARMRVRTEVGEWEPLESPEIQELREQHPGLGATYARATYVTWHCPACRLNDDETVH